jgi:hypothetical protein
MKEMSDMKNTDSRHAREARAAVERAHELSQTDPRQTGGLPWYYEALHVGDLSVLALALTD